jgi:hypothetical protein
MPSSSNLVFLKNGKLVNYLGTPLTLESLSYSSSSLSGSIGPTGATGVANLPNANTGYLYNDGLDNYTWSSVNDTSVFIKTTDQYTSNQTCFFDTTPHIQTGKIFVTLDESGIFTFTKNGTYLVIINYLADAAVSAKISALSGGITEHLVVNGNPAKSSITGIIGMQENYTLNWFIENTITVSTGTKISFIKLS